MQSLRVRHYGSTGPHVIVVHGGPGAPGHMAPVARGLMNSFQVMEPFQRGSGNVRLTVAQHVADLHELVDGHALVGSSWGAMLALAYAAAHPQAAGPLVLIGCGTFDNVARASYQATLERRMSQNESLYDYDTEEPEPSEFDERAHQETWDDMLECQVSGLYPAAFAAIRSPVLMLHGIYDPHPGRMIRDSLLPFVPHLHYREWERCGHYPWLERAVRADFFATLRTWLATT